MKSKKNRDCKVYRADETTGESLRNLTDSLGVGYSEPR